MWLCTVIFRKLNDAVAQVAWRMLWLNFLQLIDMSSSYPFSTVPRSRTAQYAKYGCLQASVDYDTRDNPLLMFMFTNIHQKS